MLALALALAPAFAADGQPGLLAFSARPNETVAVEAVGVAGYFGLPFLDGTGGRGGIVRGTARVSDRVTFDVRAAAVHLTGCGEGLVRESSQGFFCRDEVQVDGSLRVGVAVVEKSRFRVQPYVGVGTTLELGAAVWWRSIDGRFEFDFAWGPAVQTLALIPSEPDSWREVRDPGPNLRVREDASLPELGLTFHLDTRDLHHARFGHLAQVPTITYRVDPGRVAFELTGGATIAGFVAYGGLGGAF